MADQRIDPGSGTRGGRTSRERGARERRVLAVGLALSLVLHLVVLLLVGDLRDPESAPRSRSSALVVVPPEGIRAVELVEVAAPGETPPMPRPDLPERTTVRATPPAAEPPAEEPVRLDVDDRTAVERLAPRVVDARLWRPMVILPAEPSIEDVEARVATALELLSDSALAETERAMRARDWTVEDAEGGRWGISPGKLHLGKLTLPLPISFPVSTEARAEQDLYYELQSQMDRARVLESFEARVKAIRERRDRERAERRRGGNSDG